MSDTKTTPKTQRSWPRHSDLDKTAVAPFLALAAAVYSRGTGQIRTSCRHRQPAQRPHPRVLHRHHRHRRDIRHLGRRPGSVRRLDGRVRRRHDDPVHEFSGVIADPAPMLPSAMVACHRRRRCLRSCQRPDHHGIGKIEPFIVTLGTMAILPRSYDMAVAGRLDHA